MATSLVSGGNVLSFTVCQSSDCSSFEFNETSGGNTVIGGWEATGNFSTSDAIAARLIVTTPDGVIHSAIDLYPQFPTDDSTIEEEILATNLALTNLPDGVYTMTYEVDVLNVNSAIVTLSTTSTIFFSCTIKCCVDKLISKIAKSKCDCDSSVIKNAMLAFSLYQALQSAAGCGNLTEVANILNSLNKLCSSNNCGCK